MEVLYISYDGALDLLGYSQITPYLVGLSKKDVKFTLLTFEKREKLRDSDIVYRLRDYLRKENIKWEFLRYHKSPTVPATTFDIIIGTMKGFLIALRDRIQVIHARSFVGAVPALVLAKILNKKFIFDLRGLWADERVDGRIWKNKGILYKVTKWFEKVFLLNADWVVCLTEEARKIIEEFPYLKEKKVLIEVIPTCVDITKFTARGKDKSLITKLNLQDRFVLIYFGELGTWYMLDEMIDFFKMSKRVNPASFFLLLTPEKPLVLNKMMQKEVDLRDYLVNRISYKEMPLWISLADVSISFIRPLFSKKSSCPTKFAEALACGIPVIINSGIGDTDKLITHYNVGAVVNNFCEEEYAKALNQIFKISKDKDGITKDCRRVAEEVFSLSGAVEKYSAIYQRITKG